MLKKALILSIFAYQSLAWSAPVMQLKDMSMDVLKSGIIQVTYKGEKILIEKRGAQDYSLNGQTFSITSADTLEAAQGKVQKAYQMSKKRSALLDELFIKKAHAVPPLFALLFGGLIGAGIRDATCKRNGGGSEAPMATAPTSEVPMDEPAVSF